MRCLYASSLCRCIGPFSCACVSVSCLSPHLCEYNKMCMVIQFVLFFSSRLIIYIEFSVLYARAKTHKFMILAEYVIIISPFDMFVCPYIGFIWVLSDPLFGFIFRRVCVCVSRIARHKHYNRCTRNLIPLTQKNILFLSLESDTVFLKNAFETTKWCVQF